MTEKIPFMDLDAQFKSLEPELRAAIEGILQTRAFIKGPAVERFNKNFLKIHGGSYGTGCSNGTSAITVALRALGIGAGDEVLIPNHTFFGTCEPVVELGAVPVLVEIDEKYHQLDLKDAARKVTVFNVFERLLVASFTGGGDGLKDDLDADRRAFSPLGNGLRRAWVRGIERRDGGGHGMFSPDNADGGC